MDLPIEIFDVIADIAKENRIRSVKWAAASGLSPSRIADFKRWDGLRRLVGATALGRGLMRQLETKKVSTRVRIFLRLMTCTYAQLKLVDVFTDALLHRANITSSRNKS
jgi:hypothetical protein